MPVLRRVLARLPAACQVLQAEADELASEVPLDVLGRFAPISAGSAFAAGMELLALLDAAQDAGPVAVVVEDLHWADAASCQALLTVARRLDRDKVVVLISSRPGPRADGWERFCRDPARCLRVVLGALSVDEISELARRTGKALSPRHAERLRRHTGGHALYVRTLLSELSYEQLTVPDGELPAPHSLASATVAQLGTLPPDARSLAVALSVVNQRSALGEVGRIAGLRQPTAALESLLTAGFVTWEPGEIHTPVQFAHPLYRAAVYDDLSPTRRQALHHAAVTAPDGEATDAEDHPGSPADIKPAALCALGSLYVHQGRAVEAVSLAARAISLDPADQAQERATWTAALATVAACRGQWATAASEVSAAHAAAAVLGTSEAVFTARIAQAALARARDEPGGVIDSLQPLTGADDARSTALRGARTCSGRCSPRTGAVSARTQACSIRPPRRSRSRTRAAPCPATCSSRPPTGKPGRP